tara:strand:- start:649 stop:1704 length:1056 start_codon:yes stop_codon:yes gene_type:complete
MRKTNLIQYKELEKFIRNILLKLNVSKFSSIAVSKGLCDASLRGVDSHGISLFPHYVKSVIKGRKNGNPNFKISKKYPTVALLDADHAFGLVAGKKAVNIGEKLCNKNGISAVAVYNSTHPGALASILLDSAKRGYLAFAFTHADSLLKSFNGIRSYFGTNPICFVAPRGKKEPYCLDMSSSVMNWNKLLRYRKNNKKLPKGIAADKFGLDTTNPKKATSILSIGNYKGYGLASMIEILCSVLTGMKFGRNIPSMYKTSIPKKRKLGQFYIFIKNDVCVSNLNFIRKISQLSKEVNSEPSMNNKKVLLPNDPEIIISKERDKNGIPIENDLYQQFQKISRTYKIKLKTINN